MIITIICYGQKLNCVIITGCAQKLVCSQTCSWNVLCYSLGGGKPCDVNYIAGV